MNSFASRMDVTALGAGAASAPVENPFLTFAELVDAYCRLAKPNEPRDYRLCKWTGWFGDRIAWPLRQP